MDGGAMHNNTKRRAALMLGFLESLDMGSEGAASCSDGELVAVAAWAISCSDWAPHIDKKVSHTSPNYEGGGCGCMKYNKKPRDCETLKPVKSKRGREGGDAGMGQNMS